MWLIGCSKGRRASQYRRNTCFRCKGTMWSYFHRYISPLSRSRSRCVCAFTDISEGPSFSQMFGKSALCSRDWQSPRLRLLSVFTRGMLAYISRIEDAFHTNSCDNCKVEPLRGYRHKCKSCHDYDLCRNCFDEPSHCNPGHAFLILSGFVILDENLRGSNISAKQGL